MAEVASASWLQASAASSRRCSKPRTASLPSTRPWARRALDRASPTRTRSCRRSGQSGCCQT